MPERLVGRGKPKKAALAGVVRKLLVVINAMIRDRRPWEPAVVLEPSCCWVIHYDFARDSEVFVHRAGRTGRAGRAGSSVTMVHGTRCPAEAHSADLGIEFRAVSGR